MTSILFFIDETEGHARDDLGSQVGYVEAIDSGHKCHKTSNSGMNKWVLECTRKRWNENLLLGIITKRWSEAAKQNAGVRTN
jgi:hypothetical protein